MACTGIRQARMNLAWLSNRRRSASARDVQAPKERRPIGRLVMSTRKKADAWA